jgi:hypothetical protein
VSTTTEQATKKGWQALQRTNWRIHPQNQNPQK